MVHVCVAKVIKGDPCVCVFVYHAEFSAFITGKTYIVLLFDFFYSSLVCFVDIRQFRLGLKRFKKDLEFMMNPLQLVFKLVFRPGSEDVSSL